MDTQKLRHLLAIVEHGTFSDAARAVHLTQPALSRSIRALEDELRAQLFDRGAARPADSVWRARGRACTPHAAGGNPVAA